MKLLIVTLGMPVGLVLLALLGLLIGAARVGARRGLLVSMGVLLVSFYLMSTPAVGRWLTLQMMSMVDNPKLFKPEEADVLVVLTAGNYWTGGKVGWLPRPETIHRVATAYALRAQVMEKIGKKLPIVVSGGHTVGRNHPSEARTVVDFFARLGADLGSTDVEEASTDTYGSAVAMKKMATARGWGNMVLVTSESHMARSLGVYKAQLWAPGLNVVGVPAKGLWGPFGWRGWLPSVKGLMVTTDAFYDGMGLLEYAWRGWLDVTQHET